MKLRELNWSALSTPTPPEEMAFIERHCEQQHNAGYNTLAIEIGSFQGASTVMLAQYFQAVYAIDPWGVEEAQEGETIASYAGKPGSNQYFPIFMKNIEDFGLLDVIFPMVTTSILLQKFKGTQADLVFVDDGHVYRAVHQDLLGAIEVSHEHTKIIVHDYKRDGVSGNPYIGVEQAVDDFVEREQLEVVDKMSGVVVLKIK